MQTKLSKNENAGLYFQDECSQQYFVSKENKGTLVFIYIHANKLG